MSIRDRVYQVGEGMPKPDAVTKFTGAEQFAAGWYGSAVLRAGVKRAGVTHAVLRAGGEYRRMVAGKLLLRLLHNGRRCPRSGDQEFSGEEHR